MGKPAARVGDTCAHGGTVTGPGCPTVLIGKMPAARIGDMHVCPMVTPGVPPIPHVGGPISLGSTGVFIGKMPAARVGDMCVCVGPPDTIAMGCMTVLIGETSPGGGGGGGGGQSAQAEGTEAEASASDSNESSFLDVTFTDNSNFPITGVAMTLTAPDGTQSEGTVAGQIRRDNVADGSHTIALRSITSARWSKTSAKVGDSVKLTATTVGIDSGTPAKLDIFLRDPRHGVSLFQSIDTQVSGDKIESDWEFRVGENLTRTQQRRESAGYQSPSYFFVASAAGIQQRSAILSYQDWMDIVLEDRQGNPIPNKRYRLHLANGEVRTGQLDRNGRSREENIPPGRSRVVFLD